MEGGLTSVMERRSSRELTPQQPVPLWDCPGLQTTEDKNVDPFRQINHTASVPRGAEDTLPTDGDALTAGWSRPSVFSLMARASFSRLAASLYLF